MPSKTDNKLEFNQYMKSDKMAHTIYAEIESLIKKIDGVQLIQKIIQQKKNWRAYSMGIFYVNNINWAFDHMENKHTLYRRKDCMKTFSTSLTEHAENIIDFEKKKKLPLTK